MTLANQLEQLPSEALTFFLWFVRFWLSLIILFCLVAEYEIKRSGGQGS